VLLSVRVPPGGLGDGRSRALLQVVGALPLEGIPNGGTNTLEWVVVDGEECDVARELHDAVRLPESLADVLREVDAPPLVERLRHPPSTCAGSN